MKYPYEVYIEKDEKTEYIPYEYECTAKLFYEQIKEIDGFIVKLIRIGKNDEKIVIAE